MNSPAGKPDAIVIGSGPNGLAAAVTLARAGRSVRVYEAADTLGGGARTAELTLPGFHHDICSAVHPLAVGSPCFRDLPLADHGLQWIEPIFALAHPFDDRPAAVLHRSIDRTAATLDAPDASAYRRWMTPLVCDWPRIIPTILGPPRWPGHPIAVGRFGLSAALPAVALARCLFKTERARGLFAGVAAHSFLRLEQPPSAAIGLVLAMAAHAVHWPLPRGGAQSIADALASLLRSLGGEVRTGRRIESLHELSADAVVLFDTSTDEMRRIAGYSLPRRYRRRLSRYRYGPGVCKVDWALDGPIPWRDPRCAEAGTVHLGGTLEEIAAAERAPWYGCHADRPFVLLTQPGPFDPTRAPVGRQTAWGYCHVPPGSPVDLTDRIERQVERFAPGFRDRILARRVWTAADLQRHNPNYIGGDINGGVADFPQILARPALRLVPYATGNPRLYLCSAATPPGGGVHGMCGYHAARAVLRRHSTRLPHT